MILCLDLGSTTGWAYGDNTRLIPISGTWGAGKRSRFEGGGMRYLRFKNWLTEMKNTIGDVEAIYFEEVRRHIGTDAAHLYGGMLAILTSWCEHHQIPYEGVGVGTIKKHATGKGNAVKQDMIDAAKTRGCAPADDNEADAIGLFFYALLQK